MVRNLSYPTKNFNTLTRRTVHSQSVQPPNIQIPVSNGMVGERVAQARPAPTVLCEDSFLSRLAQDAPERRKVFIMEANCPKRIVGCHESKLTEGKKNMKM